MELLSSRSSRRHDKKDSNAREKERLERPGSCKVDVCMGGWEWVKRVKSSLVSVDIFNLRSTQLKLKLLNPPVTVVSARTAEVFH